MGETVITIMEVIGSIIYFLIITYTEEKIFGTVIALVSVVAIRLLATKYHWKLPKIEIESKS